MGDVTAHVCRSESSQGIRAKIEKAFSQVFQRELHEDILQLPDCQSLIRCKRRFSVLLNKSRSHITCCVKVAISIGLGQILSLFICGTAVTSGLLQEQKVQIPTAQSFFNYFLLALVYSPFLACRDEKHITKVLRQRGWKYFLLAVIDVEANYLVVKAYHFTTVTSVQLLDCFTIPTVLLLSRIFLHVHYKLLHMLGVSTCLLGVGGLVFSDFLLEKYPGDASNKILGDFMVLGGAVLYGASNVGQEYAIRSFDRVEFLGMLGMFGSVINGIQLVVFERQEVASVDFTSHHVWLPLLGFVLCLFALYSTMPVVMEVTSAASINLNLLSADFYALLFGIFLFKYQFHVLYLVSFCLIILGIIIYSIWPAPAATTNTDYNSVQSSSNIHTSSADSVREVFHLEGGDTRQTSSSCCSSVDKTDQGLLTHATPDGDPVSDSVSLQE